MKKGIRFLGMLLVAAFIANQAVAQHGVQVGIFNPGGGDTLVVKARPIFAVTGVNLSAYTVSIRWLTSYGITLGSASSPTGSVAADPVQISAPYSYQVFSGVLGVPFALNWGAGSENELFRVRISGGTGTGSFELTGAAPGLPLYIEIGTVDSTATGGAATFYITSTGAPLPVQISNFVAAAAGNNEADLHWTTVSEQNNYGFEVQKSASRTSGFQTISGSFIPGNGTTNVRHDYAYIDKSYVPGTTYYRLKQIDKDATVHYTEAIQPSGTNGVTEKKPLPTEFALSQNYPNPFNPSTVIEFALPRDARVKLEVFNILGQQVMTLVDEMRSAGYHSVRVDGKDLSSGMYLYRLSTETQSFMRKFLLLK
jgi:hypothetical protein